LRVVLDTNVLISGAFFSGLPSRILDACVAGTFRLLLTPEIVDEYRQVGEQFTRTRPNLDFERLLNLLVAQAVLVHAQHLDRPLCRDPGDEKFIACAIAGKADVIVSGDRDVLAVSGQMGILVLRPREFATCYME